MATVVLQTVGAAVGSIFGPIGSAIGSALGSMAGYSIDNALINSTRHFEGPRLNGGRVVTAEEGAALPFVYGTVRVTGTLIWATRFEEDKITERQGGKGGPKTTTYSYFGNAAYAVAEGEISGIRRIWVDGQELDQTDIEMRVYTGSAGQHPDPLIEAKQGAGNAPAYRGTAYVVFERFPLDQFGNRFPQFQFEVMRPVGDVHRNIRAVALIPGSTEFGLNPTPVSDEPVPGQARWFNRNVLRAKSDWTASIDELQALCPNLRHVAIIVPWFGDDLRAGHCQIKPGVCELIARKPSEIWQVENVLRERAHLISHNAKGATYGGTPSDKSVIAAIKDAKARGLKVTLYPFIMMDIPHDNHLPSPYGEVTQPAYPWRGRITCHPAIGQLGSPDKTPEAAKQIENFIENEWGYRRFLDHCANLAIFAGGVDAFLVGSELRGLTSVRSSRDDFPFVDGLCRLAADVRHKLGPDCKITYAADWSEYFGFQAQDGSGDLFFNLDPLWAHPAIDAIGIDNYMPLSDWRDADIDGNNPDKAESCNDLAALQKQVASGEGYDWYYASDADRIARKRTPISDGLAGKPWVYRYKDLHGWWSNLHYNRIDGQEVARPTSWLPQSKPFWFTELGCPAVDKGPNQPNVFPDPKSSENAVPYFSDGSRNDLAMHRFLAAHYRHWQSGGIANPTSSKFQGKMLDLDRIYLWAWDTRPFPEFPLQSEIWGDTENWRLGHWLNGRINGLSLDALIAQILADFDLPAADCAAVDGYLTGFSISDPTSARSVLEQIGTAFGIHGYEQAGRFHFRSLDRVSKTVPLSDASVAPENGEALTITLEDQRELPAVAEVYCNDPLRDYQVVGASARRDGGQGSEALSLPAVLEQGQIKGLAESWIARRHAERRTANFALPWSDAALHVGDRVRLPVADGVRDYVINAIEDGEVRTVKAVALAPTVKSPDHSKTPETKPGTVLPDVKPIVELIDLPCWPGAEDAASQLRVACHAKPWRGVAVYASPSEDGYASRSLITDRAIMGELFEPLDAGVTGRWTHNDAIGVVLYSGELHSTPMARLLNGANTALVKAPNGNWEVLQFQYAEEVKQNHWRLGGLLRGQLGTEIAASQVKTEGSRFVLFNGAVMPAGLSQSELCLTLNWRAGAAGKPFSDEYFDTFTMAGGARALRPLSPVHLKYEKQHDGDLKFSWIRRGRIDADSWAGEDIPLGEEREHYRVEIYSDNVKVRTVEVSQPNCVYLLDEQEADSLGGDARFRVTMLSPRNGAGDFSEAFFKASCG